jgi:uncharacterized membrane protein
VIALVAIGILSLVVVVQAVLGERLRRSSRELRAQTADLRSTNQTLLSLALGQMEALAIAERAVATWRQAADAWQQTCELERQRSSPPGGQNREKG